MKQTLNLAVCQMTVIAAKEDNLKKAAQMIQRAAEQDAEVIILPEIFNAPYQNEIMVEYAETYPGPTTDMLSKEAQKNHVLVVGGSIPEKVGPRTYNTSYIFNQNGDLITKHQKMHLFDIDIPGKISVKESAAITAGDKLTVFEDNGVCFSVIICYDCRFPELARLAAVKGTQVLIIPAEFGLTTGAAHWELLIKSRAVDNQLFVVGASAARNPDLAYQSWGHSMVVDPWGQILAECSEKEEILYANLDLTYLEKVRQELPLLRHRRTDLYDVKWF
ncbi:MAG: carbon-nitrogen hydrolase family protein [Bacillota bacterium]|nr:carbon-nitrogen hydrolase family protein [Bacillota bacterium]